MCLCVCVEISTTAEKTFSRVLECCRLLKNSIHPRCGAFGYITGNKTCTADQFSTVEQSTLLLCPHVNTALMFWNIRYSDTRTYAIHRLIALAPSSVTLSTVIELLRHWRNKVSAIEEFFGPRFANKLIISNAGFGPSAKRHLAVSQSNHPFLCCCVWYLISYWAWARQPARSFLTPYPTKLSKLTTNSVTR